MAHLRFQQVARCGPGISVALLFSLFLLLGPAASPSAAAPAGEVAAWGDDYYGQLGDNPPPTYHVTPGGVLGPGGMGFLTGVQTISGGQYHSLALKQDGTVWAWGYNFDGELGDGTTTERATPVQVRGAGGVGFLTGVTAVSAGFYHSLALKQDGTVWAWGSNVDGQLGDGSTIELRTPVQVMGPGGVGFLTGVQAISGGYNHCLALKQDGTVWAWGYNLDGELGDGTTTDRHTPVQVVGPGGIGFLTGVSAVSAREYYSLALKQDGTVWAWGLNNFGQLGDGTTTQRDTPVQVMGSGGAGFLTGVQAISGGYLHSLALKQDGTVWAWGHNSAGELGDGTSTERDTPVQVLGPGGVGFLTGVQAISTGRLHCLALKQDGTVWTWGDDQVGELGDGATTERATPVQVLGPGGTGFLTGIQAISGGYNHCLALNQDGTVWAWGNSFYGQLGDGTTSGRDTPVRVLGPGGAGFLTGVIAVSTKDYHSLALKQDGTVWAWGYNYDGEVGDGTTTNERHTPVQVVGSGGTGFLTGIQAIAGGDEHSLALKQDGTVWAWGYNLDGQLGDGTTTNRNTPGQVMGPGGVGFLTGVQTISAGRLHSLALKQDGTVWAWGYNYYGQLGDGTTTDRHTPVQVVGSGGVGFLTGIQAIAGGDEHSLALKQDGTVWAWGYNLDGELGDGTTTDRHTPVQVLGPGGTGFLTGVSAVSAGFYHSLALKQDGTVWAWGNNDYGELGDGTTAQRLTPVQVVGPGGVGFLTAVSAVSGDAHSLALKQDGTLWAWGYNQFGELGNGAVDADPHTTPAQVVGIGSTGFLHGIASISAGLSCSLAILAATPFDFNGDGRADLLWQNQATGGVTAWLMNGTQHSSGVSITDSASWKIVGAADFNGDGSPDLVWQNPDTGAVYVWFMNGLQYSGNGGSVVAAADPAWKVVGTPDMNGDGHPDILWQNSTTGAVVYWLMNGTQPTGQSGYIAASSDPAWKVVGTPDLNGDGSTDILWQNSTTGGVYVWYMNGVTYSGTGAYVATSVDPAWKVVGVPDLNGDGQPDLLWQNSTTGGVTYWLMNGAQYTGQGGSIVDSADPNWKIVGIH